MAITLLKISDFSLEKTLKIEQSYHDPIHLLSAGHPLEKG